MARHPELSLRQPEATSLQRALGFNKEAVMKFYDLLERLYDQHHFTPQRIFNVDESGFSTVQKPAKIISVKGKHQVGSLTSGERGVNTTLVCCVSAAGMYVPPMFIYKRQRFAPELKRRAPPGSCFAVSDSGYINGDIFVKWLKHFIQYVKPSKDCKILLLLDGHTSHNRNLEALELARDNGVVMVQLPAHTTHRLQPLDVAFFKPLNTYYGLAADKWMRSNRGEKITQYQVAELIGVAYAKACTLETAISCFKSTGIWPLDRAVFKDHEFAAARVLSELNFETTVAGSKEQPLPSASSDSSPDSVKYKKMIQEASPTRPTSTKIQKKDTSCRPKASPAAEITSSPYKKNFGN